MYKAMVRVRTSITLPRDLLKAIDQATSNRSAFIEHAVRSYLVRLRRAGDIRIINAHADYLNREAMDVLAYQRPPR